MARENKKTQIVDYENSIKIRKNRFFASLKTIKKAPFRVESIEN